MNPKPNFTRYAVTLDLTHETGFWRPHFSVLAKNQMEAIAKADASGRIPSKPKPLREMTRRVSAGSVQSLLAKCVSVAVERCPSLNSKRVSPHVLRHNAAMELLQAGVDCSVIALWLGHESIETTQCYRRRKSGQGWRRYLAVKKKGPRWAPGWVRMRHGSEGQIVL